MFGDEYMKLQTNESQKFNGLGERLGNKLGETKRIGGAKGGHWEVLQ